MSDVRISRVAGQGMILLRCDFADPACAEALGAVPPVRGIIETKGAHLAWMSPDEGLLLCPVAEVPARIAALEAALSGLHSLVHDMSDARAAFALEGAGWREVLAKGAPVDLHPDAFGLNEIRRTRLGQVAVAFWAHRPDEARLVCFASVGQFVEHWLRVAASPGTLPGNLVPPRAD